MGEFQELPDGLTEQQLRFGYWFATHKLLLRSVALLVMGGATAALWGYGLWNVLDWGLLGGLQERQRIAQLLTPRVATAQFIARNASQQLVTGNFLAVPAGAGKYDLVTEVNNPNALWSATITFRYRSTTAATEPRTVAVTPGQTVQLAVYGIATEDPQGFTLEPVDIRWSRVNAREVPDYAVWREDRLNFTVQNPQTTVVNLGTQNLTRTSFTLVANNKVGYWSLPLQVIMRRGAEIAAIQEVTLQNVLAQENRPVDITWYTDVPLSAALEVQAIPDIFDASVYMAPSATPGLESRDSVAPAR